MIFNPSTVLFLILEMPILHGNARERERERDVAYT